MLLRELSVNARLGEGNQSGRSVEKRVLPISQVSPHKRNRRVTSQCLRYDRQAVW